MIERVVLTGGEYDLPVEVFVAAPERSPTAALLFVHGHQIGARVGGAEMAGSGALEAYAERFGVVAASVSQPGYGGSGGPPDFCGPASQRAVERTIDYLQRLPAVDSARMILYGTSRGATVSAMVAAARVPDLRGVVLVAGVYDLATFYPRVADGPMGANIRREAGDDATAFSERSALRQAERITAETTILHGRHDHLEQAERFEALLRSNGTPVSLFTFPCGHVIPYRERQQVIDPILRRLVAVEDAG